MAGPDKKNLHPRMDGHAFRFWSRDMSLKFSMKKIVIFATASSTAGDKNILMNSEVIPDDHPGEVGEY